MGWWDGKTMVCPGPGRTGHGAQVKPPLPQDPPVEGARPGRGSAPDDGGEKADSSRLVSVLRQAGHSGEFSRAAADETNSSKHWPQSRHRYSYKGMVAPQAKPGPRALIQIKTRVFSSSRRVG